MRINVGTAEGAARARTFLKPDRGQRAARTRALNPNPNYQPGIRVIHGMTYSPEYHSWRGAKQRTTDPNNPAWKDYGGRGITMAAEWLNDFAAFLAHVGLRPGPGYSIDRIDNNRGYEPGNVRWATRLEQRHNRRAN